MSIAGDFAVQLKNPSRVGATNTETPGTLTYHKGQPIDFNIVLAQSLLDSSEQFPVAFSEAWIWLGYSTKQKALNTLESYFEESVDYTFQASGLNSQDENNQTVEKASGGRSSHLYFLTTNCLKEFGMIARTEQGKLIRKYFLECEKIAKQAIVQQVSPTLSLAPFWYQRLVLFRSQNKVPPGYFSIFQETIELVGDLETAGYVIPDSAIPDISIGLCWAKHLRNEGIEPNEIAVKYPHQYPDGRKVDANSYSEDILPKFRRWFRETYKPVKLPVYLGNKDKSSLPALSKMLDIPISLLKGN